MERLGGSDGVPLGGCTWATFWSSAYVIFGFFRTAQYTSLRACLDSIWGRPLRGLSSVVPVVVAFLIRRDMVDFERPHASATSTIVQPAFHIPMAILRSERLIFGLRRTFCDISRPKTRGVDIVIVGCCCGGGDGGGEIWR